MPQSWELSWDLQSSCACTHGIQQIYVYSQMPVRENRLSIELLDIKVCSSKIELRPPNQLTQLGHDHRPVGVRSLAEYSDEEKPE